jgi:hypothetical protein
VINADKRRLPLRQLRRPAGNNVHSTSGACCFGVRQIDPGPRLDVGSSRCWRTALLVGVCHDEVRLMESPSLVSGDARRPSIGDPPGSRIRRCAWLRSIVANMLFQSHDALARGEAEAEPTPPAAGTCSSLATMQSRRSAGSLAVAGIDEDADVEACVVGHGGHVERCPDNRPHRCVLDDLGAGDVVVTARRADSKARSPSSPPENAQPG